MDEWNIDVVLSASQKGLGAPPGLCVVIASQKAIKVSSIYVHGTVVLNRARSTKSGRLPLLASTPVGRGSYPPSCLSSHI